MQTVSLPFFVFVFVFCSYRRYGALAVSFMLNVTLSLFWSDWYGEGAVPPTSSTFYLLPPSFTIVFTVALNSVAAMSCSMVRCMR